jgi:hypothetical protein
MAMTADGRDGLALDRLPLRLGPFLPGMPPGLTVVAGLQGDVLEDVSLEMAPRRRDLEQAAWPRPLHRLVALAELVAMAGLGALARRTARVALSDRHDGSGLRMLRRRLDRPWGLRLATDGVGRVGGAEGDDVTGRWRRWLDDEDRFVAGEHVDAVGPVDLDDLAAALTGDELGRAMLTLASLRPELAVTARVMAAA